jgi:hypothetical protein
MYGLLKHQTMISLMEGLKVLPSIELPPGLVFLEISPLIHFFLDKQEYFHYKGQQFKKKGGILSCQSLFTL